MNGYGGSDQPFQLSTIGCAAAFAALQGRCEGRTGAADQEAERRRIGEPKLVTGRDALLQICDSAAAES